MHVLQITSSVVIGLVLFGIPFVLGMIRCLKFLFKGQSVTTMKGTSARIYETILDVNDELQVDKAPVKKWDYAEILCIGIAPILGVGQSEYFKPLKIPFDPEFALSVNVFILIGYVAYWMSRMFRKQLPKFINTILSYGILIGIICYLFLALHFFSALTAFAFGLISLLAMPLIAPLPAAIYAMRQLKIHRTFLNENDESEFNAAKPSGRESWIRKIKKLAYLTVSIFAIVLVLHLFGQPLDGFWQAFRGSEGFLFSLKELNI